jgi:hypothetical protein
MSTLSPVIALSLAPTRGMGISTPVSPAPTHAVAESQDVNLAGFPSKILSDGNPMDRASPFAVAWQHYPVYTGFSPLNIDRASSRDSGTVIAVMEGKAEVSTRIHTWANATESSLFTEFLHKAFLSEGMTSYEPGDPLFEILYPVKGELDKQTKPAGLISATLALSDLLDDRDSSESDLMGLIVEITDMHGHMFVYGVSDDSFTRLPSRSNRGGLYEEAVLSLDSHPKSRPTGRRRLQDAELSVVVYPRDSVRDHWKAVVAIIVMTLIALLSSMILAVFRLLVILASAQHDRALEKINKADALMSTLFPAKIKKRMMREIQCHGVNARRGSLFGTEISIGSGVSKRSRRGSVASVASVATRRLSLDSMISRRGSFGGAIRKHSPGTRPGTRRMSTGFRRTSINNSEGAVLPKATLDAVIADFHPETTIIFMDIRGFTAWCSEREPGQVFTLLESLYNSFDVIAGKRGVYKVRSFGCIQLLRCLSDI